MPIRKKNKKTCLARICLAWLYIPPEYLVLLKTFVLTTKLGPLSLALLLIGGGRLVGRLRSVAISTGIAWPDGLTRTARRVSGLVLYVLWTILLVVSLSGWR